MNNNKTFKVRFLLDEALQRRLHHWCDITVDITLGGVADSDADRKKKSKDRLKDSYEMLKVHTTVFLCNGLSVFISLSVVHPPLPQESWKMAFSWAFISRSWCECPSNPIS